MPIPDESSELDRARGTQAEIQRQAEKKRQGEAGGSRMRNTKQEVNRAGLEVYRAPQRKAQPLGAIL